MGEPKTLTEAVNRLKTALTSLDWTDAIYGRVSAQVRTDVGQDKQLLPMAYVGDGEYIDCRPDDERKSVLFFYAKDSEKNDFSRDKGHAPNRIVRPRRAVTLMGWVNLEKLPDYDDGSGFAELIKIDLKAKLKSVGCVASIGDYRDGPINEVFRPFVISATDRIYDEWPWCCFSLDLNLICIETKSYV